MAKIPGVLVIDQDADARFQVQRMVKEASFENAGVAGVGTEAVSRATEVRPDIILCGLREPLQRSVQTVESLIHALPETPVIAYSSSADVDTIRQAMRAGARDFLQMPFKADDLKRSLVAALESEERRRLREAGTGVIGPQGSLITVFGAKGGVGKTTIATNLAVALARVARQKTALVDADDTFGDTAGVLGLMPESTVTSALRALDADGAGGLARYMTQHESGLGVLASPENPFEWRGITGERVQRLLQQLAREFDSIVVDTGSTLSDVTVAPLEAASLILWVTTPEYASVRDSLAALQAVRQVGVRPERIRLVLNVSSPEAEVQPASVEQALGLTLFWTIPYDRQLRRTAELGRALVDSHPHSPAAESLSDLARVLSGGAPVAEPEPEGGFLRRLLAGRELGLLRRNKSKVEEEARL